MKRLKRSDNQYFEIENFKDYELTNCIAEEMYSRTPSYISLGSEVKGVGEINIMYPSLSDVVVKTVFIPNNKDDVLEMKIINLLDIIVEIYPNYFKKSIFPLDLKDFIDNFLHNKEEIFQDIKIDGTLIDKNYIEMCIRESNISVKASIIESRNSMLKYELPTPFNARIVLNLSLPKKEIIAYVSKIKDRFDENQLLIRTPIELLDEEINRADNLVCDTNGKCFDARSILSKQQKLADMFYIYDCLKLGYSYRVIQNEIFNYYMDQGIETKTMDNETLKKYKQISQDYINNGRYKELITGVPEISANFKNQNSHGF